MGKLSVSQSYLLCTLNEKGKLPALRPEAAVCLVAGGIMDLVFGGSIALNNKKVSIIGELSEEQQYLKSLYESVKKAKGMAVQNLASEYTLSLSDKKFTGLLEDVGRTLVEAQCATLEKGGLFGKATLFVPNVEQVNHITQQMRTEMGENGQTSEEIMLLVTLLEKSGQLKQLVSKDERKQLKKCIKEMKENPANQVVKEMVDYTIAMLAIIAS
ncbi:MAG: GPP34 family phosphoprotein [Cellulosilyticaceae bacterium]